MKKLLSAALALMMVLSLLSACGGNSGGNSAGGGASGTSGGGSSGKDTVVVRCEQIFFTMHPLEGIVNFPNLYVLDQVYEGLTRIDDSGVVQPRLHLQAPRGRQIPQRRGAEGLRRGLHL